MYLRLNNRADIYSQTTTPNAAGQKKATWNLSSQAVRCEYEALTTVIRVAPTFEEMDVNYMFFGPEVELNYKQRIYNISDRNGNIITAGPFEIIKITKLTGYTGKVRHQRVMMNLVIE